MSTKATCILAVAMSEPFDMDDELETLLVSYDKSIIAQVKESEKQIAAGNIYWDDDGDESI